MKRENRSDAIAKFSACMVTVCLTAIGGGVALAQPGSQLTVYDLDGNELGLIGAADEYADAVYSPDGSRIAAATSDFRVMASSLRIIDSETGATTIIEESGAGETVAQPVWSPDGRALAYVINSNSGSDVYRRVLDGGEDSELVFSREDEDILLSDWSREGLLFVAVDRFSNESRLYLFDPEPGSEPTELAQSDQPILNPKLSPDSRYLSYFDNEGALFVMRATPATDGERQTWQMTSGTGSGPFGPAPAFGFWDVDDPYFYQIEVSQGVRVVATPVDTTGDFEFGEPTEVLSLPITVVTSMATLSPDAEQLLIVADPPRRLSVVDADGSEVASIDVPIRFFNSTFSPDFRRATAGTSQLFARDATWDLYVLDAESNQASLIGVGDDGGSQVWSPDGREVAFVVLEGSQGNVYRRPVDDDVVGNGELIYSHGGSPIVLSDWSLDGRYLAFSSGRTDPLSRLHVIDLASGGEPVVVAEDRDAPIYSPRFSPDGRYLSYVRGNADESDLYVTRTAPATEGSDPAWRITSTGTSSAGFWDSDDALLYYLDNERNLMTLSVDTSGAFESGEPRQILTLPEDAVERTFTMRHDGERMLYERQPLEQRFRLPSTQIVVRDRNGGEIERFGASGLYERPKFSPDGARVIVTRRNPDDPFAAGAALQIFELGSGEVMEIAGADDEFEGSDPVWMADGEHIAYAVNAGMGRGDDGSWVYRMRADGQGEPEGLFRTELGVVSLNLTDVSRSDEFLLIDSFGVVQAFRLTGDDPLERHGIDTLRDEFEFRSASLSPDMRLVAYTYNDDEQPEVYLSHFDAETGSAIESERYQVTDGLMPARPAGLGFTPNLPLMWRDDGQELYFSARGQVMAVSVSVEPSLQIGEPRPLFDADEQLQDVSGDGQRFLFVAPVMETD